MKTKLFTWAECQLKQIFHMTEEEKHVECTNCKYGHLPYSGTDEIRGTAIEANEIELKNIKCPLCDDFTLVRIEKVIS